MQPKEIRSTTMNATTSCGEDAMGKIGKSASDNASKSILKGLKTIESD